MISACAEGPPIVSRVYDWQAYFQPLDLPPSAERWRIARRKHGLGYGPEVIRATLEEMANRLRGLGATVYLVDDVPTAPSSTPEMLAKAYLLGTMTNIEPRTNDYRRENSIPREAAALGSHGR